MSSFQPTLPARGATRPRRRNCCAPSYFNPRSPHGERQTGKLELHFDKPISTHAPRTGSDPRFRVLFSHSFQFQPTLPARGATIFSVVMFFVLLISTHAPARGATISCKASKPSAKFQPTLPHGERPGSARSRAAAQAISTHAPARGATSKASATGGFTIFQPTLPHGERRWQGLHRRGHHHFNPRSRTGSDTFDEYRTRTMLISTHAPARGATLSQPSLHLSSTFQPTLPHGERPHLPAGNALAD